LELRLTAQLPPTSKDHRGADSQSPCRYGVYRDAVEDELDPYIQSTSVGAEDHLGKMTRRTGALVARSTSSHS
jgi:hypothetical protein